MKQLRIMMCTAGISSIAMSCAVDNTPTTEITAQLKLPTYTMCADDPIGACIDGSNPVSVTWDPTKCPPTEVVIECVRPPPPAPDTLFTCSNDLDGCPAGYGAVESLQNTGDCPGFTWRLKCVRGAENP